MTSSNGGSDWTGVTPHFSVGDIVGRRYRIERLLRQDVFGSLYQVRHIRYGQALILKVFHPFHFATDGDFERLRSNFDAVRALRHVGTVRYLEVQEVDGQHYVTMDQIEGKSLRELLDEYLQAGQVLTLKEARRFVLQTLTVLKSIAVPHGNLRPENLILPARIKPGLMGETSDIRLVDFALIEVNTSATGDLQLAPASEVAYTAPEVIAYGGAPSQSGDVYSLAAIFYEMLTGTKPSGESVEPPSKLRPDVPEEFDFLFEACLNREPTERLHDIKEMEARLSKLSDEPTEAVEVRTPHRRASYVLGALVVAAAAAGGWLATRAPELDPKQQVIDQSNRLINEARAAAVTDSREVLDARRQGAPKGMAYIPAGSFVLGFLPTEEMLSAEIKENLLSALEEKGKIQAMQPFYIDRYDAPNLKEAEPRTAVSWDEANQACQQEGKRLCTAEEWERACKGPQSYNYPYGMDFDPGKCPPSKKANYKVGDADTCQNEFKVHDMAGGTWEWTATASPEGPHGHIVKGGYPGSDVGGHRCSFRNQESNDARYNYLSYRCCLDLGPDGSIPQLPAPPAAKGK